MSSAFAIAAVSAVLKDLLIDNVINGDFTRAQELSTMGDVQVTALSPDRIDRIDATTTEVPRINLFMYQVMPNTGWRNAALPSRDSTGNQRLSNRPLALDLHYFLTAYGPKEFYAEALLGYAMQLFHEHPVLTADEIRSTLRASSFGDNSDNPTPPEYVQLVSESGLADQVEQIKITPLTVNGEEMSRLWMAMQAKYRPTAAYQVSVVLIQADKPKKNPLPVAKQGSDGRGPAAQVGYFPPIIESVKTSENLLAALPGDTVVLKGQHLTGGANNLTQVDMSVTLTSPSLPYAVPVTLAQITDKQIIFKVPEDGSVAAGLYTLTLRLMPNNPIDRTKALSVTTALMVAPQVEAKTPIPNSEPRIDIVGIVSLQTVTGVVEGKKVGEANIEIHTFVPVMTGQKLVLLLGSIEVTLSSPLTPTKDLTFTATNISTGTYPVRLSVDGVESRLVRPGTDGKLRFDESQKVIINE